MSSDAMVISAFGFVDETSYGGTLLGGVVEPLPNGAFSELRWETFSDRPFERYGRLDILSRYAVVAVELLGLPQFTESQLDMALVMGTGQGCLAVDLDFRDSMDQEGGGSPLLFMYTLHNACLGEIAIRYNITGANLCLMAGQKSGLSAIWEGLRLINCGEAASCICLAADALGKWAHADKHAGFKAGAYCILIESASHAANRGAEALAYIKESKGKQFKRTPSPSCQSQLSNLHNYLSEKQQDTGMASKPEMHLNLYSGSNLLYIDRC